MNRILLLSPAVVVDIYALPRLDISSRVMMKFAESVYRTAGYYVLVTQRCIEAWKLIGEGELVFEGNTLEVLTPYMHGNKLELGEGVLRALTSAWLEDKKLTFIQQVFEGGTPGLRWVDA